jgi:hypothetical protein
MWSVTEDFSLVKRLGYVNAFWLRLTGGGRLRRRGLVPMKFTSIVRIATTCKGKHVKAEVWGYIEYEPTAVLIEHKIPE